MRLLIAAAAVAVIAAGIAVAVLSGSSSPADPDTAAAVHATASRVMGDFAGARFDDVWQLLTPAAQASVPEPTWDAVYHGCARGPFPWTAGQATLNDGGSAAGVEVTVGTIPVWVSFDYIGGRWRYSPASLGMFARGSVPADITADKAQNICP
jgi:hypothetical protein